jgi:hypothetical protein
MEAVMAATTFSATHVAAEPKQGSGLLRRIFAHMVKSREAEAKRQMARTLWSYSDESLNNLGLTRQELNGWLAGRQD